MKHLAEATYRTSHYDDIWLNFTLTRRFHMRVQADQNLHSICLPAHGLGISSILFASEMEADVVFCLSSDRLSPLQVCMKERNI